jgi:antagonist of KipI
MPSLTILQPGLLCSIQDIGRKGLAYYAIPTAGVMDQQAAKIALLLLNKSEDSPLIECTAIAPHIRFNDACQIAISGADFSWTLNGKPVVLNNVIDIRVNDILRGKMATNGLRGYIAIRGNLKLDKVYDSYATYANAGMGGYQGRYLQKGDVLEWEAIPTFTDNTIPIRPGPEYDYLSDQAKKQLVTDTYTISNDSNRMGMRLLGDPLQSSSYQLANSLPVLPGFIQLPPSGLPMIILQDGQTTGGYPRIAYVPERYFPVLNQIPLGGRFRFRL